ncbi:hypothetical protein DCE93_04570 [Agromyces badenianii]|uniref:Uncharacterized protein n=1 Tax=Agromyces badenianii TaxID=2080742 RepID=A0A2S0WUP3_9MICO|nr:hypothetical protein [Agromyces badenianii]AWB95021.1 hypothetical protein DCE93_04570 [Agromyces badenianii]
MNKNGSSLTAAPDAAPMVVTAGAFALLASAGLFLINAIPLLDPAQYEEFPPDTVAVVIVALAAFSLPGVLIPLLAAFFALRGSRWPAFVAAGFATMLVIGVIPVVGLIDENPIYVAGAIAALLGAVLLWLPTARAYGRVTVRNRRHGLSKQNTPVA